MPNRLSSKGVTLVEVMISLVILLIVFMGLISAAVLSIDSNVRNEVRDQAVSIASETMADARRSFSTLAETGVVCAPLALNPAIPAIVNRTIRNQSIPFTRCAVVNVLDVENRRVMVTVTWPYRGENPTHSIISVVRNK